MINYRAGETLQETRTRIIAYNTVERLLLGDYFHFSKIDDLLADLKNFDPDWPVLGIGTTNWYRRNGETIITGTAGSPQVLWADPNAQPLGSIVDLRTQSPEHVEELESPYVGEDDRQPQFPFLALGVCDPAQGKSFTLAAGINLHHWAVETLADENIGLAAIKVQGDFENVKSTAAYHLPLGGAKLTDGYNQQDIFRFLDLSEGTWSLQGLYAVNPTIQAVLSVPGFPAHLHGYEVNVRRGGHINQAIVRSGAEVTFYPIKDIHIRIRDLDRAVLPIKNLD